MHTHACLKTSHNQDEEYPPPPKVSSYISAINNTPLQLRQPLIMLSLVISFAFSRISYKQNYMASFAQHIDSQIHTLAACSTRLYGYTTTYPVTCYTFGSFWVFFFFFFLGNYKQDTINIHIQVFVVELYFHFFWGNRQDQNCSHGNFNFKRNCQSGCTVLRSLPSVYKSSSCSASLLTLVVLVLSISILAGVCNVLQF